MDWIEPMEPILRPDVVQGTEWIHQVKWDGVRGLCKVENGLIRVFTKSGRERTGFYPELDEVPKLLKAKSAYLDGEIVIFDESERPSFYLMLTRERLGDRLKIPFYTRNNPARYIVFDLLMLDGKDLTKLPLRQRRALLKERLSPGTNIVTTDDFSDGDALLDMMKRKGWEGIVSKRASSQYTGGKNHHDWYKTKLLKKILAVVCGLSMKDSRPNSLILGIRRGEEWVYIGKASIGLSQDHFSLLSEMISEMEILESPFSMKPVDVKDAVWFKPILTCWVSFLEWTNDGGLRHPKIAGFSEMSSIEANGQEFTE